MRAYVVNEWKHPSKLVLVHDAPEPVAGPEDVIVDVYSAGLNFFDVRISVHTYAFQADRYSIDITSPGQISSEATLPVHARCRICREDCDQLPNPKGLPL